MRLGTHEFSRRWLVVAAVLFVAVVALIIALVASASDEPSGTAVTRSPVPITTAMPKPTTATTTPTPTPLPTGTPVLPPTSSDGPTPPASDTTLPPVPLDEPAAFGTGMTARLTAVESVEGEAQGPGEVAGPAVRVTIVFTNGTGEALALNKVVVNVFAGADLAPGEPMSGPGVQWFDGTLEAGAEATGVYVFAVPADRRDLVHVRVSYDPVAPTVVFEGPGTPA